MAAIKKDGSLWTWGNNFHGQLGDGTFMNKTKPVKILEGVQEVSLGANYAAAIKKDGSLWTWGSNYEGQLGDGTFSSVLKPKQVMSGVEQVDCYTSTFAIQRDGSLWTWGDNEYGQLGDGTSSDRSIPTKIAEDVVLTKVWGYNTSVMIKEDGSLWTWGSNKYGQLGDGTTASKLKPIKIMDYVKDFSGDDYRSLALKQDGSVWIWGRNPADSNNYNTKPTEVIFDPTNIPAYQRQSVTTTAAPGQAAEISALGTEVQSSSAYGLIDLEDGQTAVHGLLPEERYNYYIMRSRGGEDALSPENLLYIRQLVTDAEGSLQISGIPREEDSNASAFLVGAVREDLSQAEIFLEEMHYNGEEQIPELKVYVNNRKLTLGEDYEIHGTSIAKEVGSYALTIHGIGLYQGSCRVSYEILEFVDEKKRTYQGFDDIKAVAGDWKYESAKYVYEYNIMNGITNTRLFAPDRSLDRAMFATVLYRMSGSPEKAYRTIFTDVKEGQYYSEAVVWAKDTGIVTGFDDGSYGVSREISREELAKMLYIYGENQGYDVSGRGDLEAYTDDEKVNVWAKEYIRWAVDAGMISGKPNGDGTFCLDPKGKATRAECAKILMMFREKYKYQ